MSDLTKHIPRHIRGLPAVQGAVVPSDLPPGLRNLEAELAAEAEAEQAAAPPVQEKPPEKPAVVQRPTATSASTHVRVTQERPTTHATARDDKPKASARSKDDPLADEWGKDDKPKASAKKS